MTKWYFRLYYVKLGGHYHCRLFSGTNYNGTFAGIGTLIVSEEEWIQFREAMDGFEFRPDERQ